MRYRARTDLCGGCPVTGIPTTTLSVDGGVEFGDLNPRYGVLGGGRPYPSCSLDLANQENPCVGEQIAQDDRQSLGGPI